VEGETWLRVAVLGAGAVGCYFGGMLARAGVPITLIGRPLHVEAIERDGLCLETLHFQERIPVAAAVAVDAARDAAVVLFCVKTLDTDDAARSSSEGKTRRSCIPAGEAMSEATSCTAQDIQQGDPTPVNGTLHPLVKLLEETTL
jgi:ketopantoate reductase